MEKAFIIKTLMENNFLASPDFLNLVPDDFDVEDFIVKTKKITENGPVVLNNDLFLLLNSGEKQEGINWQEFEKSRVELEKGRDSAVYNTFLDIMNYNLDEDKKKIIEEIYNEPSIEKSIPKQKEEQQYNVVVLKSYTDEKKSNSVQDFVGYFKVRYETIKNILLQRIELQGAISINRLLKKNDNEQVAIVGLVLEKSETKNGNIILKIEDPTGTINVHISKTKAELYELSTRIVSDEVVGILGFYKDKIVFVNNLFFPEIPIYHELKKSSDEAYAVFTGDIHIGLKYFLADDFMKFIKWLKGEFGNEAQRDVASKIGYVFITGDLVEGVGIYPGQEKDLDISDIYKQYEELARYLAMIPEKIKVIICGGNHDAMRLAEPQPIFDFKYAAALLNIHNLTIVSNPALINIHSSASFPGFDVLMYHGSSFPYYADNLPFIRSKGGMARCDLIMRSLLQKRHLAPSHGSTLYIPDPKIDSLIIDRIPDIFISGHIHQITVSSYKNINLINSSCWVTQTEDQEKRGIIPHPAKVPIMNLKTREVRIMNFRSEQE